LKKTGSTIKYGVIHENWLGDDQSFLNPIDSLGRINKESFPLDFDYVRSYCISKGMPTDIGYESSMMKNNLVPFEKTGETYKQKGNYAYHLNINNTLAYFKVVAEREGIKLIKSSVNKVKKSEKIESLKLSNGEEISGDLFVDCTGQKRILSSLYDQKFVKYNELPLNSAITYSKEHEDQIRNYTLAKATSDGWQWEIPVKDKINVGYIYNSSLVDETRLMERFGSSEIIRFQSGRISKFLNRNILSVGLSSGFVEPLEATSLHTTLVQLNVFLSEYFRPDLDYTNKVIEERYNKRMGKYWDSIRDWIRMHYFTTRKDTKFWQEVQLLDISIDLEEKMEIFKTRMPRESDIIPEEIYQNSLTFHVLGGMKILDPNIASAELDFYKLREEARRRHQEIHLDNQNFIRNFVSHKYYLDNI
jgi:tryptophan halogenase